MLRRNRSLALMALLVALATPLCVRAQGEGILRADAEVIELTRGPVRVELTLHGGRVLQYSVGQRDAMWLDDQERNPEPGKPRPVTAGRFDIGPELTIAPHPKLWSGKWQGRRLSDVTAELTSEKDEAAGIQLTRTFQLRTDNSLLCTQTMTNISPEERECCHWGRSFSPGGGICVVPLAGKSRFPGKYAMYEESATINVRNQDDKIRERDGCLEILGPPRKPKLGFDSQAGWLAYVMPDDTLFVKRFATFPDRVYSEAAGLTLSVWYPPGARVELEPIGPRERLKPSESASFSEEWYLLEHPFPKAGEQLNLGQLREQVSRLTGSNSVAAGIASDYEGLKTADYLGELKPLAKVVDAKVFTEGPCCDRAGNVFFTNTEESKILKWDGRELTTFREKSGAANGLLFDRQGRLVACEGNAGRVTRTDMTTGKIEVLCDEFQGHPLGSPNDLCFDGQGRIYFTSRLANVDPKQGNVNSVYRIDTDGKVSRVVHAPDIHMPNGIVTSPDDKTLYLIESHPQADHHRSILAFPLAADGTLGKPTTLINFYPGRGGDGMAIDEQGNLYVAAGLHKPRKTSETLDTRPGIHVISPQGKLLAFVETPEDTITNCRFGSANLKTLYITCGSQLLSLPTKIAGKASYRPEK